MRYSGSKEKARARIGFDDEEHEVTNAGAHPPVVSGDEHGSGKTRPMLASEFLVAPPAGGEDEGGFYVLDVASTNHTYVNDS